MPDAEDDLFGDSDSEDGDTDDMIADARAKSEKPAAKKKMSRLQKKGTKGKLKKKKIPDADNDTDSDDDAPVKKKKRKDSTAGLSKKERMEALARKRQSDGPDEIEKGDTGYDSVDSAIFERTKEDDDFIDDEDEDPSALAELYAPQHFEEEEAEEDSEDERRKKKQRKRAAPPRKRGPDALSDLEDQDGEPANPILAAVHRMKKKKKGKKTISEWEEEANEFISLMKNAAEDDDRAIKERRPATKKISILTEILHTLAKKDMTRHLLDADLLVVVKKWIQPLPNGTLGNITVRQRLLAAISAIPCGEKGIEPDDLKRSGIGKTIMGLYMHRKETPHMKRQLKSLIEQWSRPIFNKSGNMKDLGTGMASRREGGIAAISRAQMSHNPVASHGRGRQGRGAQDVNSLIAGKGVGAKDTGSNRVRVPYSKGFQFTVRPENRMGSVGDARRVSKAPAGGRNDLSKRMVEKNRPGGSNKTGGGNLRVN